MNDRIVAGVIIASGVTILALAQALRIQEREIEKLKKHNRQLHIHAEMGRDIIANAESLRVPKSVSDKLDAYIIMAKNDLL